MVTDAETVRKVIQDAKKETPIGQLITTIDLEELALFVYEYADRNADFSQVLQRKFTQSKQTTASFTDYAKEIKECFTSSVHHSSSYSRYSHYEEPMTNSYEASNKLDSYLEKAVFLLEEESFEDVASIALQAFHGIGVYADENQEDDIYDEEYIFTNNCEAAAQLLTQLIENTEVPQSLKEKILDELNDISKYDAFQAYMFYDITTLLDNISSICLTTEELLKRTDKKIAEASKDSFRTKELLCVKIDLLRELNRTKEMHETIEEHLHHPEIRKRKITLLLKEKRYEEALLTIDQGIEIGKKEYPGRLSDWKKEKLNIYLLTHNIPLIILTAKEMFISMRGDMDSYRLLKKHIAHQEWKPFLKSLIAQTEFFENSFSSANTEATIYVEEKDEEQLMSLIQRASAGKQLHILTNYANHLKNSHPAEIITLYTLRIEEYADQNIGRKHYEYIVEKLKEMKVFEGGTQAINELLLLFRTKYKKRTAMMEILKKI